ncbi:(2Fe-2S)-binding protein [Ancylobacter sp. IITR112]|uniref:(2Fe-2S)-binding protein n=1 Tax=Ancylobacter sp. IITR112 TaxID=3138073 RepID=UPI00352A85F0
MVLVIFTVPGLRHGRKLLARRRLASGAANPLAEPVRYLADGTRQRRVCCLRHLVPALAYCGTCPLDRPPAVRSGN